MGLIGRVDAAGGRLERSESRLTAACRILSGRAVAQRRVQARVVVVVPVFLAQHFCLQQAAEALPVQELVTEPAVEALAVGVRCNRFPDRLLVS